MVGQDRVRVVLQQKVVIRNGPHRMPDKPFFSANYWDIDNAGYGMGIGRIAGADQRVEQGMINAILDILAYAVNPEYSILRGANVPTQDQRRRLGGIRVVDGPDATRAVSLVPQPQVPADAWRAIQAAISSSEGATGADQASVQGSLPGRGSSIGRSGTGAGMISAASSRPLAMPRREIYRRGFSSLPQIHVLDGQGVYAHLAKSAPSLATAPRICLLTLATSWMPRLSSTRWRVRGWQLAEPHGASSAVPAGGAG